MSGMFFYLSLTDICSRSLGMTKGKKSKCRSRSNGLNFNRKVGGTFLLSRVNGELEASSVKLIKFERCLTSRGFCYLGQI